MDLKGYPTFRCGAATYCILDGKPTSKPCQWGCAVYYYLQTDTMNTTGPIIVIDDDPDDRFIMHTALANLDISNPVVYLSSRTEAINYIKDAEQAPFIVSCAMVLQNENATDLRRELLNAGKISEGLVPFVFLSCPSRPVPRTVAYDEMQSFHKKPGDLVEWSKLVSYNIRYWSQIASR